MKLLGLSEDMLQLALMEENERVERSIVSSRRNVASYDSFPLPCPLFYFLDRRNRKYNKKALTIVGYDPSKEKVVAQLGEESFDDVYPLFYFLINFFSFSNILTLKRYTPPPETPLL